MYTANVSIPGQQKLVESDENVFNVSDVESSQLSFPPQTNKFYNKFFPSIF